MITINKTRPKNNNYQFAYITLAVDGDTCRMVVSTPTLSGDDLQTYCDAREAKYQVNVLGGMYPDARWRDAEGKTDLEKFTNWIIAGHTNTQDEDGKEIPGQVIEKVPWADMHPEKTKIEELTEKIDQLTVRVEQVEISSIEAK